MVYSVMIVAFFAMHLIHGEPSHKHVLEDHYIGHQHNPEHDMDVLLGTKVRKDHPLNNRLQL